MTIPTLVSSHPQNELVDLLRMPGNTRLLSSLELLKYSIKLPLFTKHDDWLSVKIADMVKEMSLLCLLARSFCSDVSCPSIHSKPRFGSISRSDAGVIERRSAPAYMRDLIESSDSLVRDRRLFPVSGDCDYPAEFKKQVRNVCKRMLHVYAHIYSEHSRVFHNEAGSAALNTSFMHFYLLVEEFQLIEDHDIGQLKWVAEVLSSGTAE